MGVAWREGGDARELLVQGDSRCEACGVGAIALSTMFLPLLETDQARWEEEVQALDAPPAPPCPACGQMMVAQNVALVDVPEESTLGALALVRSLADDGHVWCVAERPQRRDPVILATAAHLDDPVGEGQIAAAWGRALAPRAVIRMVVGAAMAHPEEVQTAHLSPELFVVMVRPPAVEGGSDEELAALADRLAQETMAALKAAGEVTGEGDILPIPLSVGMRQHMARWLAPWSEEFGETGSMIGIFGLRAPAVMDAVEDIARRHGASPVDDPRSPERRVKERREGQSEEAEMLRWLTAGGIPFGVSVPSTVIAGLSDGLTPADALARAIGDMVAVCERARSVIERIGALDDAATLEVVDINQVIIRRGEARVEMNLESILRKSGTDADAIDQVRGAVAFLDAERELPTDAMPMLCGCTDTWTIRHLRAPDFAADYAEHAAPLRDPQSIADDRGQQFVALACVECLHQAAFLMQDMAPEFDDLEAQLQRDRRRVQLPVSAHVLRDAGGEMVGALVRGPNVATTLINPPLAAALLEGLGRRVPLGQAPLAVAPTTDLMILLRSDVAEDESRAQALIEATMANSQRLLDPHMRHGTSLGYTGVMERGRQSAGKVPIRWSEEAALF